MLSAQEIMQLVQSLIWLLAGVGVFIVGMNFMGDALEKSASVGMKRLLTMSPVALMQVKKEMEHLICLVEENMQLSFVAIETGSSEHSERNQTGITNDICSLGIICSNIRADTDIR